MQAISAIGTDAGAEVGDSIEHLHDAFVIAWNHFRRVKNHV